MNVLLKTVLVRSKLLALAGITMLPGVAGAQVVQPDWEGRAYQFVGAFFKAKAQEPKSYRLRATMLPVVSPYADNFDLRKALTNDYLNTHQFITTITTDSLLSAADFEAMRQQLNVWQTGNKWRVRSLRAQGVKILVRDRRSDSEQLFPKFTTYQVFPPLFSVDGRTALFYVENYCGMDCAGGDIHILRQKPDGSWKRVLTVMVFIS